MTAITALLRQIDPPPLANRTSVCAMALVEDAMRLATEWSRGDDLAMISDSEVAQRNATAILLEALIQMLVRDKVANVTFYGNRSRDYRIGGVVLAELLVSYRAACAAERADDAWKLDAEASDFMAAAEEIVSRFRDSAEAAQ